MQRRLWPALYLIPLRQYHIPQMRALSYSPNVLNSSNKDFVILNPHQTGLLKKRRRGGGGSKKHSAPIESKDMYSADVGELLAQLGHDQTLASRPPAAAAALDAMRPEMPSLSQPRFEQTLENVRRGYSKQQLRDYLAAKGQWAPSSASKAQLATSILHNVWGISAVSLGSDGSAERVENTIELGEREFFLMLGNNGQYIREWSKSGARVSFNPKKSEIIVQSTPETYEWIQATITHLENSIVASRIDLKEYSKLVSLNSDSLRLVQRLTDTYFGHAGPDSLVAYSIGRPDAATAARLLLWFLPMNKWRPQDWWYDNVPENVSRYTFRPFADTDALPWLERPQQWARWEAVRTRKPLELAPLHLHKLVTPRFASTMDSALNSEITSDEQEPSDSESNGNSQSRSLATQLGALVEDLIRNAPRTQGSNDQMTLTATPGYLLHEAATAILPNAGLNKTFCTNVPYVARLAGSLPMYSRDVAQEEPLADTRNPACHDDHLVETDQPSVNHVNNSDPGDDIWRELLHGHEEDSVFSAKRSELGPANLRLTHLKLVPSPHETTEDGTNLCQAYPPVEIWVPMGTGTRSKQLETSEARIVAVPHESVRYVSLPGHVADLRLSLQQTRMLELTDAASRFLRACVVSPRKVYIPRSLHLEIEPGHPVRYLYQSSAMVTQAELEFSKGLLQLVQSEGGKLGGRSLEASVVYHAEDPVDFRLDGAKDAAQKALEVVEALPRYS